MDDDLGRWPARPVTAVSIGAGLGSVALVAFFLWSRSLPTDGYIFRVIHIFRHLFSLMISLLAALFMISYSEETILDWEAAVLGLDPQDWRKKLDAGTGPSTMASVEAAPDDANGDNGDEEYRTPGWWRRIGTRGQLAVLAMLMPGVLLHELTHDLAARGLRAGQTEWVLDDVGIDVHWNPSASPPWKRAVVHLAPLLVGIVTAIAAIVWLANGGVTEIRWHLLAYIGLNYMFYTWAGFMDLRGLEYLRVYLEPRVRRLLS